VSIFIPDMVSLAISVVGSWSEEQRWQLKEGKSDLGVGIPGIDSVRHPFDSHLGRKSGSIRKLPEY
jgi:hypothetical protein